jgi:hypothetical protein
MGANKAALNKPLAVLTKSKYSPLDLAHIKQEAVDHYVHLERLGIMVVAEDCGKDSWGLFLREGFSGTVAAGLKRKEKE